MPDNKVILICAGGTGGHLFPAQALSRELGARGWTIHLATDDRASRYSSDFPAVETHIVKSATIGGRNPFKMIKAAFTLGAGYRQSRALVEKLKPAAAIGFGGYPTVPPIIAASAGGALILLHEQNAVMGRANRLLAKKARAIAMGFGTGKGEQDSKVVILGNPVREEVLEAAKSAYKIRKPKDQFNVLIFGGSQGARYFSEVMPEALKLLDNTLVKQLNIVQQAREEDEQALKAAFNSIGVKSEVSQFFSPMAQRIANAHLVIGRGGASTISECAVIGRPSILVPYPLALDHDQAMNAAELEKAGGCKVIKQIELTPQRLADELKSAIEKPQELLQMATNAKKTGKPDASKDFARLVEHVIAGNAVEEF
ncbi:MAG: undecaprenyldiphospho-muramoylpentapeptide beta-N-acetylglucosaminyltransferase [Rhizobiaceae bacterium]|nr:undecaprenyldiphospho-muramoylpentapeptide beta-N-acetylglucosaminyltransferase [Rhizobiaceae bacterium]